MEPKDLLGFLKQHGMRVPPQLAVHEARRILIIANAHSRLWDMHRVLKETGYGWAVEAFDCAVAGCMEIPVFRPHLVLFDVDMKGVDGAELCRSIKGQSALADTCLVAVSANGRDQSVTRILEAGADEWLSGLSETGSLIAKIRGLLTADSTEPIAASAAS